jgi:hypothetical protein
MPRGFGHGRSRPARAREFRAIAEFCFTLCVTAADLAWTTALTGAVLGMAATALLAEHRTPLQAAPEAAAPLLPDLQLGQSAAPSVHPETPTRRDGFSSCPYSLAEKLPSCA